MSDADNTVSKLAETDVISAIQQKETKSSSSKVVKKSVTSSSSKSISSSSKKISSSSKKIISSSSSSKEISTASSNQLIEQAVVKNISSISEKATTVSSDSDEKAVSLATSNRPIEKAQSGNIVSPERGGSAYVTFEEDEDKRDIGKEIKQGIICEEVVGEEENHSNNGGNLIERSKNALTSLQSMEIAQFPESKSSHRSESKRELLSETVSASETSSKSISKSTVLSESKSALVSESKNAILTESRKAAKSELKSAFTSESISTVSSNIKSAISSESKSAIAMESSKQVATVAEEHSSESSRLGNKTIVSKMKKITKKKISSSKSSSAAKSISSESVTRAVASDFAICSDKGDDKTTDSIVTSGNNAAITEEIDDKTRTGAESVTENHRRIENTEVISIGDRISEIDDNFIVKDGVVKKDAGEIVEERSSEFISSKEFGSIPITNSAHAFLLISESVADDESSSQRDVSVVPLTAEDIKKLIVNSLPGKGDDSTREDGVPLMRMTFNMTQFQSESIDVNTDGRLIEVRALKKIRIEGDNMDSMCSEEGFSRIFEFPAGAHLNPDKLRTNLYEDGVLSIEIPIEDVLPENGA